MRIVSDVRMRLLNLRYSEEAAAGVMDMLRRDYLFKYEVLVEVEHAAEEGHVLIIYADEDVADALLADIGRVEEMAPSSPLLVS